MDGCLHGGGVPGGTISGGLQRNGAEVASCCNTPIHRWGALAIRPGGPAADTMAFMHRVSGWLGRLSVGRKLMLIYLLDLTAVIYVSSILIHEKYLAIDFTRKEVTIVGSRASVDCFPEALDLIASGRIGYPKIASFLALEEAQTVFETLAENPTAYHKAVFRI